MVLIPGKGQKQAKERVQLALVDPHDAKERFDSSFILSFECPRCGLVDVAPRVEISAAIKNHLFEECPKRLEDPGEPIPVKVYYPRQ